MTLGFLNSNRDMLGASLLDCMQSKHCFLLYLLVSTRAVIGQFSGPYSPVRPVKI